MKIFFMNILGVRVVRILIFKSSWSLIFTALVRAARALLCTCFLKVWGGVGIYDSKDRRMSSDLSHM